MLNTIFAVVGASGLGKVTMEDLAVAAPIVLVIGIGIVYWANKAYEKEQMKNK